MNLNQVTLPVSDMEAAVDFYRTLGFNQVVEGDTYVRFECPNDGSTFSLMLEQETFSNGAIIYFEHEQLDEWADMLVGKGIEFDQMPTDMPYLWREAVLKDPSGNKIKLYWAGEARRFPPWRVNNAG